MRIYCNATIENDKKPEILCIDEIWFVTSDEKQHMIIVDGEQSFSVESESEYTFHVDGRVKGDCDMMIHADVTKTNTEHVSYDKLHRLLVDAKAKNDPLILIFQDENEASVPVKNYRVVFEVNGFEPITFER